jgi:glycerol-3-phosphate acyltransferase PlsX
VAQITLAVDAMGGDFGPHVVIPACEKFLQQFADTGIVVVGDEQAIRLQTAKIAASVAERIEVLHADQVVDMDEKPSATLRGKPRSSMRLALEQLRNGRAGACVSAGNTGALMALGVHVVGRLDGIDRPAICSEIPTGNGNSFLLDLGANVDSSAENLLQFAQMAASYVAAIGKKPRPTIALLNIGEEQTKGNAQVKAAAALMSGDEDLNYVGFIEGNSLFDGEVDVIVCDGFIGNVALKTSEGVAQFLLNGMRAAMTKSLWARFVGMLVYVTLRQFHRKLDPRRLNGAIFLGLRGVVIKSHGNADAVAFRRALEKARDAVKCDVVAALEGRFGLVAAG